MKCLHTYLSVYFYQKSSINHFLIYFTEQRADPSTEFHIITNIDTGTPQKTLVKNVIIHYDVTRILGKNLEAKLTSTRLNDR